MRDYPTNILSTFLTSQPIGAKTVGWLIVFDFPMKKIHRRKHTHHERLTTFGDDIIRMKKKEKGFAKKRQERIENGIKS
jgi:hypothetical protein